MQSREFQANSIPFAPVLHPTAKEFSDFNSYIDKVEKQYSKLFGMVKIVPPKGWKAREQDYEKSLDDQMITGPIEQNPYGKGGVYECVHIMKKSIPFREYKKKARDFDKVTEGKSIEKVEELFWKNISFSPPLYGSDMQMSLFDEGVKWSLNDLQSMLSDGLSSKISGVNTPYLYIGSWKTLFAWHKEDLDLGAINFLHYGKPKFWYCISRDDSHKLESIAKQNFAENFAKCPEFLRHKTTVINPYNITKKLKGDLKISKIAQEPGEFIIVFSGAYHHGFNWGYNIAEAVNYASLSWLDYFPTSRSCRCTSDSVSIDHQEFIQNLLKKRPEVQSRQEVQNFQEWLASRTAASAAATATKAATYTNQQQNNLCKHQQQQQAEQLSTTGNEDDDEQAAISSSIECETHQPTNPSKLTSQLQQQLEGSIQTNSMEVEEKAKQEPKKRGRKPKIQNANTKQEESFKNSDNEKVNKKVKGTKKQTSSTAGLKKSISKSKKVSPKAALPAKIKTVATQIFRKKKSIDV